MVQHRNISDAERHEPKGASAASSGQVLSANGDGSTTFVAPTDLINVSLEDALTASSTTAQNPSGTDTALQVTFGPAQSLAYLSIATDGAITVNEGGAFAFNFTLNVARAAGTSASTFLACIFINGVATSQTYALHLPASAHSVPFLFSFIHSLNQNDVVTVEVMRDSAGEDIGSLEPITVTGTWDHVPSAYVDVKKLVGAN